MFCFHFISYHLWNWKQIVTYDNDATTDGVATDGWIVFEICSKHEKKVFEVSSSRYFLLVHQIAHQQNGSCWSLTLVFNVQYNEYVNHLIKGCCTNVIVYSCDQVSRLTPRCALVPAMQMTSTTAKNVGIKRKVGLYHTKVNLFTSVYWIKRHFEPTRDITVLFHIN